MIALGDNGKEGPMSSLLSGGLVAEWQEWHWNLLIIAGRMSGNDFLSVLPAMLNTTLPCEQTSTETLSSERWLVQSANRVKMKGV